MRKQHRAEGIASTRNRENGRFVGLHPHVEEALEENDDIMMDRIPESQTQREEIPSIRAEECTVGSTKKNTPLKINEDMVDRLYAKFHNQEINITIGDLLRSAPQLKYCLLREQFPKEAGNETLYGGVNILEFYQPQAAKTTSDSRKIYLWASK